MIQGSINIERRAADGTRRTFRRHNTPTTAGLQWAAAKLANRNHAGSLSDTWTFQIRGSGNTLIKTLTGTTDLTSPTATVTADDVAVVTAYTPVSVDVYMGAVHVATVAVAEWTPAIGEIAVGDDVYFTYSWDIEYYSEEYTPSPTPILQSGGSLVVNEAEIAHLLFGILAGTGTLDLSTTTLGVFSLQQTMDDENDEYALADTLSASASVSGVEISYAFSVPAAEEPTAAFRERLLTWGTSETGANYQNISSYDWGERPQGASGTFEALTLTLTITDAGA